MNLRILLHRLSKWYQSGTLHGRKVVRKEFTITATPEAMQKFENFLAFLHFNGGHSGIFGMEFDGDGADMLKTFPPPNPIKGHQHISAAGHELEVAYAKCYRAFAIDRNRTIYSADDSGFRLKKFDPKDNSH